MKDIRESLIEIQDIVEYINEQETVSVDEGLKDIFNSLKAKFKQVINYLKGFVAKALNSYWIALDFDGNILNATTPLTTAQAYADGKINRKNTVVIAGKQAARMTGCKGSPKLAFALYGSGNSMNYWEKMLNEDLEKNPNLLTEVKLQSEDPAARYNVVDTPELKDEIKATLMDPNATPLLIWGAPGIGKTAILRSVLSEIPGGNEYNIIVKTLSNETPDNFTLPKYCEVKVKVDGKEEIQEKATDVPKDWLPVYKPTGDPKRDKVLSDACGKGLLFIDELSRATPQVLNVILPLVNERVFNGYNLGDDWTIICASNRMEDEAGGNQYEIGNALGNRFAQLYYEPTVKTWREWADKQNYMSPLLLQWLSLPENESMSGGKYFYYDPNQDSDSENTAHVMCTPRSWTNAMRRLACFSETGNLEGWSIFDLYHKNKRIIQRTLNQYVPAEAIDAFMSFLAVLDKVGNFDQFCDAVWHGDGNGATSIDKKDIGTVAIPVCQLLVTSMHPDTHYPTSEEFTSLCKWLVKQGSDQLVSFIFDTLIAVYGKELPDGVKNLMFTGGLYAQKFAGTPQEKVVTAGAQGWFNAINSKYGLNVKDLKSIPDWTEGYKLIAAKFKDVFASVKLDGMDVI